jgi:hypothetical protein
MATIYQFTAWLTTDPRRGMLLISRERLPSAEGVFCFHELTQDFSTAVFIIHVIAVYSAKHNVTDDFVFLNRRQPFSVFKKS